MNTENEKLLNEEIEFARKQFAKIDKEIQLPASLSGAQLMKKMKEQQAQEKKTAKNNVIQWPKRIIPLAACFAVVIGIVAGYDRMFGDISDVVAAEEAFEEAVVEEACEEFDEVMPETAAAGFTEEGAAAYSEEPAEYDRNYINERSVDEGLPDEETNEIYSENLGSGAETERAVAVTPQQERNKRKNSNRKKAANKTKSAEVQYTEQSSAEVLDEQYDDLEEDTTASPAVMMLKSAMSDAAVQSNISAFEEYSQLEAKLMSTPSAAMAVQEATVAVPAAETVVFEATEDGYNITLQKHENGFRLNTAKNGENSKYFADVKGITDFNTLFIKDNKVYIIGTFEHEGIKTVKLFVCPIAGNAAEGIELFAQTGDFYAAYMDESCLYILGKSSVVGSSGTIELPSYAVRSGEKNLLDIKQIYYSEDISALDFITVSAINFSTENIEVSPKAVIANDVDVELNGVLQTQTNSGVKVCLQGAQIDFK